MMKRTIMAVLLIAAALPLLSQEWEIKLEDYYTFAGINNSMIDRNGDVIFIGCVSDVATDRNSCVMKVGQNGDIDIHVFQNDTLFIRLSQTSSSLTTATTSLQVSARMTEARCYAP